MQHNNLTKVEEMPRRLLGMRQLKRQAYEDPEAIKMLPNRVGENVTGGVFEEFYNVPQSFKIVWNLLEYTRTLLNIPDPSKAI